MKNIKSFSEFALNEGVNLRAMKLGDKIADTSITLSGNDKLSFHFYPQDWGTDSEDTESKEWGTFEKDIMLFAKGQNDMISQDIDAALEDLGLELVYPGKLQMDPKMLTVTFKVIEL